MMVMDDIESHHQPHLPFDDSTWAEDMLVYEYGKHCQIIGRAALLRTEVSSSQVRVAEKMVKNTEWYWLQQIMFRFHEELSMREMVEQRALNKRLMNEQGQPVDIP